eukprot:CAMPEP_0113315068 /NCGR_PEP_ID=MMETSP0010_2-20120614/10890_1 /TAXON_ID=216773 ORGANISM="Corethron hystrix, Strain 308" /NCGR_SAMPLE_ID=MMETSP0010_2 /ASSEMBLY_ACC=CAM_ASM_000155 /LENGTH=455 /DNA_ID=CAMNT_0000171507 /DNA_START=118 /DNA_END=1482 /DNA_ORIENTATION=+ /assembly_acc=CAM_ASM_000155
MLVLYETPGGYGLFKLSDPKKSFESVSVEDAATSPAINDAFFSSEQKALDSLKLVTFQSFRDTAEAVSAAASTLEGKLSKSLKSLLKKHSSELSDGLAVQDKALGTAIREKLSVTCLEDARTHELFRGVRCHADALLASLGLAHSMSRYKLKFSPDKVDTMIVQAVGLLDELDKEINTYAMRVREWYGWHFPEMAKIVNDNIVYAKIILETGMRTEMADKDFSAIVEDEATEAALKEAAQISMGTEISLPDILNIQSLATNVISMSEYRAQLFDYLRNRMNAIAPNLTVLVGELVGARLISHAGSLMNLAKHPASTVQILGAEKALFRALKTKHDTPKYGLIYHASLVGQASAKNKGKIARVLAAKSALACRVDALADDDVTSTIGYEGRQKVEARLRQLEGGAMPAAAVVQNSTPKYSPPAEKNPAYNDASDMQGLLKSENKQEKKEKKEKKSD